MKYAILAVLLLSVGALATLPAASAEPLVNDCRVEQPIMNMYAVFVEFGGSCGFGAGIVYIGPLCHSEIGYHEDFGAAEVLVSPCGAWVRR